MWSRFICFGGATPRRQRTRINLTRTAHHARGMRAARHGSNDSDFRFWHIASFRCGAEFTRYRDIAGVGQSRTNQARFGAHFRAIANDPCSALRPQTARRANHLPILETRCPSPRAKIFRLTRRANHCFSSARLTRERGGSRSSRTLRWDAVDAGVATDERDSSGRRSRVVLAPRRWR